MNKCVNGRLKLMLYMVAALALFHHGISHAGSLTICNEGEDELWIAGLGDKAMFFEDAWTMGGWWNVKSGVCKRIVDQGSLSLKMYATIKRKDKNKKFHIWMSKPNVRYNNYSKVEKFFCVSDNALDRRRLPLSNHARNCPSGWYLQLFNFYFDIPGNLNYTLTLGG